MKSFRNNGKRDKYRIFPLVSLCQEISKADFVSDRDLWSQEKKTEVKESEEELIKKIVPLLEGHTLYEVTNVLKALKLYIKERSLQTMRF